MEYINVVLLFSLLINIYLLFKFIVTRKAVAPLKTEIESRLDEIEEEKRNYALLLSQKKQSEIRLGQIAEQFVPFIENFSYDPKKARFIGSPIDLVVFDDEEIIFLEIKTGKSQLNANQRRIKKQVEEKKIKWDVIRVSHGG